MNQHKWGHNELQADLASHLRVAGDKVVWENMQMGPAGSARPDVYVMPKSYSKFRPITYEIKISVSDFRSDITSGKWQSYLQFSSGVIFAVPAGLITKEDVPKGCGLIVRHDEIWRMAKAPTLQHIEQLPKDCWMKLMIDGIERQHTIHQQQTRHLNTWAVEKKIRQKYGEKIAAALSDLSMAERRLAMAKEESDALADDLTKAREKALAEVRMEAAKYSEIRVELCNGLGLPVTTSHWAISNKCHELARRLDENKEIQRLQRLLKSVQDSLNEAKEPLPKFEVAA